MGKRGIRPADPLVRLLAKVNKTDGCWLWTASTHKGYGQFYLGNTMVGAHVASYILHGGCMRGGMELDHKCRNKLCVRPSHLRPSTRKQNSENRSGAQANSSSGLRGVYRSPSGRWRAMVKHNRKQYYVGTYDTPELAAEAARCRRNELFTHNDEDRTA